MLIVGSAMGLGETLCQQFEFGNLPCEHLLGDELAWTDQNSANQAIKKLKPTIVVNALPLDLLDADTATRGRILENNHFLLTACQAKSIIVLQLSSASVFKGGDKKAYDDTDKPCAEDPLGKQLRQCEKAVQSQIEKHLLLRFGWLIDAEGDNLFTRNLQELYSNQSITVDPSVKGVPLWMDDALRVVLSLVRQLLAGSDNWGVFHYGSADPCSAKEFAQQLIEILNELTPEIDYQLESVPIAKQLKNSEVLKCRRIRNNFGVHGRTWRQGLKYRVQHWLEGRWLANESVEEAKEAN